MCIWEKEKKIINFSCTFPYQFWKNWKLPILFLHSFAVLLLSSLTVSYFCVSCSGNWLVLTLPIFHFVVVLSPTHRKLLCGCTFSSFRVLTKTDFTTKRISLKIADPFRMRHVLPHPLLLLIPLAYWSGNCKGCQSTCWYQKILDKQQPGEIASGNLGVLGVVLYALMND